MKTCTLCGVEKEADEFYRNSRSPDGRQSACKSCRQKKAKSYNQRDGYLRRTYGISEKDFDDILETQGGVCKLCKKRDGKGNGNNLSVDHCHQTGRIRGLLCAPCNRALGVLGDNEEGLRRALEYVTP